MVKKKTKNNHHFSINVSEMLYADDDFPSMIRISILFSKPITMKDLKEKIYSKALSRSKIFKFVNKSSLNVQNIIINFNVPSYDEPI